MVWICKIWRIDCLCCYLTYIIVNSKNGFNKNMSCMIFPLFNNRIFSVIHIYVAWIFNFLSFEPNFKASILCCFSMLCHFCHFFQKFNVQYHAWYVDYDQSTRIIAMAKHFAKCWLISSCSNVNQWYAYQFWGICECSLFIKILYMQALLTSDMYLLKFFTIERWSS